MRDGWRGELAAMAVITGSLLVAVALATHWPHDPSFFVRGFRSDVRNVAGPVGATLSQVLLDLFGLAAFLIPAAGAVLGWRLLLGQPPARPRVLAAGWALLMTAVPATLGLLGTDLVWRDGVVPVGGFVGRGVDELLELTLGPGGRLAVLVFLLVAGAVLTAGFSPATAAQRLRAAAARRWEASRAARMSRRKERERRRRAEAVVRNQARRQAEGPSRLTVKEVRGKGKFRLVRRRGPVEAPAEPERPAARPSSRRSVSRGKTPPAAQETFDFVEELDSWVPPPLEYLDPPERPPQKNTQRLVEIGETLTEKCREFRVAGEVVGITTGPVITTYEFRLSSGVKIAALQNLAEDLALAIRTESVRIERIPGRATVGIEVPNPERQTIRLRQLLETPQFASSRSFLTLALGVDIHGNPVLDDLKRMPHLLIGGFTGSGKSVGINAMIMSILYKARPEQVKLILVDPKMVELGVYRDIPHLLTPIISDPKKAANALGWAVAEMERRYQLLAATGVRNLDQYNRLLADPVRTRRLREELAGTLGEEALDELEPLPFVVVVIDELHDLMMTSSRAVEESITRLAQKARAVGIHLIVATQRPSVDVITGTIKANFPCRIAYKVRTRHDSRTILDSMGAERLLGRGDMLYLPPGTSTLRRLHGPLVTEVEIARVVRHVKRFGRPEYRKEVLTHRPLGGDGEDRGDGAGEDDGFLDPLFEKAARIVVETRQGSTSFLQRRLRIGYTRAARLMEILEREGIVGPVEGAKGREVLVPPDYFAEVDATAATEGPGRGSGGGG